MFKSIEMDNIIAQGGFQSEKEMTLMEENEHSILYKFPVNHFWQRLFH